jgi:hypothetical protein
MTNAGITGKNDITFERKLKKNPRKMSSEQS